LGQLRKGARKTVSNDLKIILEDVKEKFDAAEGIPVVRETPERPEQKTYQSKADLER